MTSARLSVLHIPITLIVAISPLTNAATPVNAAHSKQLLRPLVNAPGFEATVVADGLYQPTSIASLPGLGIAIAEQSGVVRVWRDGVLSPSPLIDLRERVNGRAERGLLAIAAHPRFESNGDLYLLYTSDAPGLDATRVGERTFK
jgi:glucose/arabinose dehydrogenase